jgi:hypothetical protein
MLEKIFTRLPELFVTGSVKAPICFYFSLDDVKKTIFLAPDGCTVHDLSLIHI